MATCQRDITFAWSRRSRGPGLPASGSRLRLKTYAPMWHGTSHSARWQPVRVCRYCALPIRQALPGPDHQHFQAASRAVQPCSGPSHPGRERSIWALSAAKIADPLPINPGSRALSHWQKRNRGGHRRPHYSAGRILSRRRLCHIRTAAANGGPAAADVTLQQQRIVVADAHDGTN